MRKNYSIKRKRLLILGLLSVECIVFVVGGVIGLRIVREQMASMIGEQVKADNARYAEGLAGVIESMGVQDATYGSKDWRRMQNAVEGLEMPAGGFACILDAADKIVCHPELDDDPQMNEGSSLLYTDLGSHLSSLDEIAGGDGETRVGESYFLADGVHYIATREIAGTGGHRLLVHQPAAGLVKISDAITTPLMLTFVLVGASVMLLTVGGSYVVARRYEHTLEAVNAGLEDEVGERTAKHTAARNALIFGLAKLADSRDPETGAHLERLCAFSTVLAEQLQREGNHPEVTDEWIREIRLAAALHDIGKVGVADNVLRKPGRLNEEERAEIERHPQIAADTLLGIYQKMGDDTLIACSVQVALYHHEKWDGSGYPFKLEGEGIPLAARIVAVADVYDALTSKRVYKDAMPHEQACKMINENAGSHFDPVVVQAFERVSDTFEQIKRQTNEGNAQVLSGIFG
ncbi:MAG: HD-GYP domain-containing protein [Phycisphaeraceae bacterium]|nr:HD-GYP domain-containing protein [Phycisphaeraceae bacterium]